MVSVIIPVYNSERTLGKTLESVACQTFENFEAVIVDNCSSDSSASIAEAYTSSDTRFRMITCGRQGVSNARNAGIEASLGEYLFFLDSDDRLHPDALSRMVEAAEREDADIVIPNILRESLKKSNLIDTAAEDMLVSGKEIFKIFNLKLSDYLFNFPFKLFKAPMIKKHGVRFDPAVSLGEDLLFVMDALDAAKRIYFIADPLYFYNASFGGLNSRYRSDLAEAKFSLDSRIKRYIERDGKPDSHYYLVLLRDVFAVTVNERIARNSDGIRGMLRRPEVRELKKIRHIRGSSFFDRLALICVKLRLTIPLYLAAGLWLRKMKIKSDPAALGSSAPGQNHKDRNL